MENKYYIKCNHCGRLVQLKSQYMVLCPECRHKMDNSYEAYRTKNPKASYQEYLSEVCVNSLAMGGLSEQRRITRRSGRSLNIKRLLLALTLAVVAMGLVLSSMWLLRGVGDAASIKSIMADNWRLNYYEDIHATLKFPFMLESSGDSLATDSSMKVERINSRRWSKESVASITALCIDYVPDFGVDRTKGTEQVLQSIVSGNVLQGFQCIPSDYKIGTTDARMFSGSYLIETQAYEFRAVMVVSGDRLWYFMVAYLRSEPEGTLLAEKFFRGIVL
ncbi:MAG: hypothetical protein RR066_00750 [Mucinivorans sp.]